MPATGAGPDTTERCGKCGVSHPAGPGFCTTCRALFTDEERRAYIRAGTQRTMRTKDAGAPTREEAFEAERKRLASKRRAKRR